MSNRLSGKVCIITGTGGGVAAVRAAGGTMVSIQPCDLTKPGDCKALIDFAVHNFGRIDVLFNNAAMAYFNWLEDISDEKWDRNGRSEVDLVFYLTRAAWPYLKASRGAVVNTASLTALMSFKNLGSLAHTTAKAGIIGMTRQLAMEGREHGIRANLISPGVIETNQAREHSGIQNGPATCLVRRCWVA
jgi:NAD(P)-dependent dehydrogenase (short-subunit alcohol dehydrogenase family)